MVPLHLDHPPMRSCPWPIVAENDRSFRGGSILRHSARGSMQLDDSRGRVNLRPCARRKSQRLEMHLLSNTEKPPSQ